VSLPISEGSSNFLPIIATPRTSKKVTGPHFDHPSSHAHSYSLGLVGLIVPSDGLDTPRLSARSQVNNQGAAANPRVSALAGEKITGQKLVSRATTRAPLEQQGGPNEPLNEAPVKKAAAAPPRLRHYEPLPSDVDALTVLISQVGLVKSRVHQPGVSQPAQDLQAQPAKATLLSSRR
jgi:hypothetical protein